ncbi:FumA C-terminus/TtdB family hydratase beta subunit [Dissulfurispira sp.]|uniref:FumA C-terminus/TtdB family hydratase beta subunit n=1 Tax=Dissulfurispira sp. TaxID=2817609 RepID=UPI002FD9D6BF
MVEKSAVSSQQSASKRINTPLAEDIVMSLRIGDMVLVNGLIVTGRDKVHKFLAHERPDKKDIPFELHGGIIYHCGPIIKKVDDAYKLIAAGPTTSMRVEMYEADVIKTYGIRGIIGKGGMGNKTLDAMKEYGCVYLHTISGAAAYLADRIKNVRDGWKIEEFGAPEAMWLLEVEDFPAIVTMDARGNSLHREVENISLEKLRQISQNE